MYKSFFKLTRDPFEVSPDPYFLYTTPQHNEALAGLYYGITARKGFMVLTGEVGTGKTLVGRCLLNLLDRNKVAYAYVFNSLLSSQQFLHYVVEDLGVSYRPSCKSDLLLQLNTHLMKRYRQGQGTVLVVDEAQHLTVPVLEEIRLLTNLETAEGKLLQIVLLGQPELDRKLASHPLRQLKQRVALRFRLQPLSEVQTRGYLERRLKLAGDERGGIFSLPAIYRIHVASRGIPRLINILADNALIAAYALGQRRVTAAIVDEAAADLGLRAESGGGSDRGRNGELAGGGAVETLEADPGSWASLEEGETLVEGEYPFSTRGKK
jgi:general secretion pathway protein A